MAQLTSDIVWLAANVQSAGNLTAKSCSQAWDQRLFRCQSVHTQLGHAAVLIGRTAGNTDGPDDFSVNHPGQTAFDRIGAAQRKDAQTCPPLANASRKAWSAVGISRPTWPCPVPPPVLAVWVWSRRSKATSSPAVSTTATAIGRFCLRASAMAAITALRTCSRGSRWHRIAVSGQELGPGQRP